jgi:hypothetical protein
MYNEVTVKVLKSPNRLLKDTLLLTPLISLRPFFCILNTALLSYTPPPKKNSTIFLYRNWTVLERCYELGIKAYWKILVARKAENTVTMVL